ncbi:TNF receptor-associated factor 5 [Geodia barretti]|uniref:TNF receptor-associated factor 5 n=1 Tax=Geodia barretti TaxID=519541 RepID=A0AA35T4Z8_GEOBA|nr:TNF receptor-associated factor 5 [Geodia barretti]
MEEKCVDEDAQNMSSPPPQPSPPTPRAGVAPLQDPLPPGYEYDFVTKPPDHFFCAVSMELLLDPQQTECCGHHFASAIAERLKREKSPCPMCKEPLTTHPDKFHRRSVNETEVRCLYRAPGGCQWVGQLGNLRYHVAGCPKQPWTCVYCNHTGYKEEEGEHNETCDQLPVPCPNGCEVGAVPRCQLDQHRLVCLSEEVACEYAALGCTKRLRRRDVGGHMEEGKMEHLVNMCAANLTLTRQLKEKLDEKDAEIVQLQSQLAAMEGELKRSIGSLRESTSSKLAEVEQKLASEVKVHVSRTENSLTGSVGTLRSSLLDLQRQLDATPCTIPPVEFVVTNFEALKNHQLEWRSPPFHTHQGGYKMCLGISPYGVLRGYGTHVSLRLYKMLDSHSDQLPWDVRTRLCVHAQNQSTGTWEHEYVNESVRSKPEESCVGSSAEYNYIRHAELKHYVRNNQMKIRVTTLDISPDISSTSTTPHRR